MMAAEVGYPVLISAAPLRSNSCNSLRQCHNRFYVNPAIQLRRTPGVTAAIAVVFLVMGWGIRGNAWAIGVSAAVVTLALAGLVYAAMFALVWLISLIGPAVSTRTRNVPPEGKA